MATITTEPELPVEGLSQEVMDPVLAMRGVGKELWRSESGDDFIARLRAEEDPGADAGEVSSDQMETLAQMVWARIERFGGQEFRTQRNLKVTYAVEGDGIWFFRDGVRVNRKLSRRQVEIGISRCPLRSTTEINDLIDYPYLFAVLMDRRIRGNNW